MEQNQEEWLKLLVRDIKRTSSSMLQYRTDIEETKKDIRELKSAMPPPTSITNDTLKEMLNGIKDDMIDAKEERKEIKEHVKKTNGRVNKLEIWRGVTLGGLGVLSTIFTGLVIPIIYKILTE